MTNRYITLLFATGTVVGGCSTKKVPVADAPALAVVEPARNVSIEVENHNWLDVVVYAVHGGQRTRLLTAPAASSVSATLPPHVLAQQGEMHLLAHAVGNPNKFLSERIFARSGMTISWTLETDLKRSSLAVW